MASKDFEEWLSGQPHKRDEKIPTGLKKNTLKYLVPDGVKTWGDWYDAAKITPDFEKPKKPAPTKADTDTTKYLKTKITIVEKSIEEITTAMYSMKPGSTEYKEYQALLAERKTQLLEYKTRYTAAEVKENTPKVKKKNVEATENYEGKVKTWEQQVAEAEDNLTRAKDTNGDVPAAKAELERVKGEKPKPPKLEVLPKGLPKETPGTFTNAKDGTLLKDGKPYTGEYVLVLDGKTRTYQVKNGTVPTQTYTVYNPNGTTTTFDFNNKEVKPGTPKVETKPTTPETKPETPKTPKTPATTDGTTKDTTPPPKVQTEAERRAAGLGLGAIADKDFVLPETLFNNEPELTLLLKQYSDPKVNMSDDEFLKKLRSTVWYTQNSGAIKQRYIQLYNYRDLVNKGQAKGKTQYEQDIEDLKRKLIAKSNKMGSDLASNPDALQQAAENWYITNVDIDNAIVSDFIAAAIRPVASTLGGKVTEGYSGQALKDYKGIQAIAKANGFKVSDIIPGGKSEVQVLQELAKGNLDANRIAQDARRLAAQGQPTYVRDLLGQGYDLEQIYAPYKNTMASILEINPDQISLDDNTLRMAISDKGDMNIYEFKKQLKADRRWQYTEQAREEVSNATLQVLRDFGFQG